MGGKARSGSEHDWLGKIEDFGCGYDPAKRNEWKKEKKLQVILFDFYSFFFFGLSILILLLIDFFK